MPQHIAASDLRLTLPGAISTEMTDDRVMPWRIPYVERNLFAKELVEKAAMPAGVRIRFQSNTSSIEGFCNSFPERSPVDLLIDGGYVASAVTQNKTAFRFGRSRFRNKNSRTVASASRRVPIQRHEY